MARGSNWVANELRGTDDRTRGPEADTRVCVKSEMGAVGGVGGEECRDDLETRGEGKLVN